MKPELSIGQSPVGMTFGRKAGILHHSTGMPIVRRASGASIMKKLFSALIVAFMASSPAPVNAGGFALAHAPVDAAFSCTEHFAGQFIELGDALGTDCIVTRLVDVDGRLFSRMYSGDGSKNEDWYGWRQPLLSPCDCEVMAVNINPVTNEPGKPGKPPASLIMFRRDDGVWFVYGHLQEAIVRVGDKVTAGQAVARIGNNGYGRVPHVHVGAWRGEEALQIRWDQSTMKLPPEFR